MCGCAAFTASRWPALKTFSFTLVIGPAKKLELGAELEPIFHRFSLFFRGFSRSFKAFPGTKARLKRPWPRDVAVWNSRIREKRSTCCFSMPLSRG